MRALLIRKSPMRRTTKEVESRIATPPATWKAYVGQKDGLFDVIEMEFRELEAMRESGTHQQVVKELVDLAAAATLAANRMTCKESKA